jgi:hypothetical protein
VIKSSRVRWERHVEHFGKFGNMCSMFVGKVEELSADEHT